MPVRFGRRPLANEVSIEHLNYSGQRDYPLLFALENKGVSIPLPTGN
jgi:hypothetical protein